MDRPLDRSTLHFIVLFSRANGQQLTKQSASEPYEMGGGSSSGGEEIEAGGGIFSAGDFDINPRGDGSFSTTAARCFKAVIHRFAGCLCRCFGASKNSQLLDRADSRWFS